MNQPLVSFTKKGHIFTEISTGKIVPGVTTIVKEVKQPYKHLPPSDKALLEWEGERGNAVHKAAEFDLKGTLDESSIKGVIEPYFESWRKAKKKLNIRHICCEKIVYHLGMYYAGILDIRAMVTLGSKDYFATIDLKTSYKYWKHFVHQPAAYMIGWWNISDDIKDYTTHFNVNNFNVRLPKDFQNTEKLIVIVLNASGNMPEFYIDFDVAHEVKEWTNIINEYNHKMNEQDKLSRLQRKCLNKT